MSILALETATEYLSVAVTNSRKLVTRDCLAGHTHSELILPMIDGVLAEAGVARADIGAIAFGAGPGSFTGLRIACGVAQGLAFGLGVPVIPISTLEAIAEAVQQDRVVVALDARMGEIYHAAFERAAGGWRASVPANLCKPENAPALLGSGWVAAGNGFAVHGVALASRYAGQLAGVRADLWPHARMIAELAMARYREGRTIPASDAAPIYIRNKVALTVEEQAASR